MKEEFNPIRSVLEGKKLKGTAKLTITNTKTGKSKTTVHENMITNAVKDLFASNYSGLANFQEILPVRNFFSGCLMFEEEVNEDASSYMPPADEDNKMIACAGSESHSSANPYRGNPDGSQTEFTPTSATFVWHWTEGQGNGDISCISLCPGIFGNMGLKPFDNTYHPFKSFNVQVQDSGWGSSWTEDHAICHPLGITPSQNKTKSIFIDSAGMKIIECLHDLSKYGITRGITDFDEIDRHNVTLPSDLSESTKLRIFETSSFYAVVYPNGETSLTCYMISKSDFSVTTRTYSGSAGQFLNTAHGNLFKSCPEFLCNDTFFFWPNAAETTWNKCYWSSALNSDHTQTPRSKSYRMSPMKINNKLILAENFLYNSGTIYPLSMPDVPLGGQNSSNTAISACVNKHMVALFGTNNTQQQFYGLGTTNMFLSTINNLDVVRTKTSTDVMKLEYVISEV